LKQKRVSEKENGKDDCRTTKIHNKIAKLLSFLFEKFKFKDLTRIKAFQRYRSRNLLDYLILLSSVSKCTYKL
jgi:hypothetical protein